MAKDVSVFLAWAAEPEQVVAYPPRPNILRTHARVHARTPPPGLPMLYSRTRRGGCCAGRLVLPEGTMFSVLPEGGMFSIGSSYAALCYVIYRLTAGDVIHGRPICCAIRSLTACYAFHRVTTCCVFHGLHMPCCA
jgi:hypothetical protein